MKLEIKKIGNSTGLILPKDLLAKLDLKQGEWVNVTENSRRFDPSLDPMMPNFDRAMEIADEGDDGHIATRSTELAK